MKTTRHLKVALLAVLPLIAACKKKEQKIIMETSGGNVVAVKASDVIWPAVEASLRSQVEAFNREDVAAYMSYVHPDSSAWSATRENIEKTFREWDLKTTIEKMEPVSVTDGETKAHFVQLTEKVSGPGFRNNRTTGTHILRKDGGVWKVFSTVQDKIDYLDTNG